MVLRVDICVWVRRRDQIGSSRSVAPLKKADDAVYLDSTGLSVAEVMARVVEIVDASSHNVRT